MNVQEIFDKVVNHLLTQNKKSVISGRCVYRGHDGLMCAVGVLIEDEHYIPKIEHYHCSSLKVREALSKSGIDVSNSTVKPLLSRLQDIHDNRSVTDWYNSLKHTAKIYNLKWNF